MRLCELCLKQHGAHECPTPDLARGGRVGKKGRGGGQYEGNGESEAEEGSDASTLYEKKVGEEDNDEERKSTHKGNKGEAEAGTKVAESYTAEAEGKGTAEDAGAVDRDV